MAIRHEGPVLAIGYKSVLQCERLQPEAMPGSFIVEMEATVFINAWMADLHQSPIAAQPGAGRDRARERDPTTPGPENLSAAEPRGSGERGTSSRAAGE